MFWSSIVTLLTLCSAVWLDIKYYSDYQRRVSAIGFLDGTISVFVVNVKTKSKNFITYSLLVRGFTNLDILLFFRFVIFAQ